MSVATETGLAGPGTLPPMLDPQDLIVSWNAEEQTMRVRRDGSRFLAKVTITALRDPARPLRLDKQA